MARRKTAQFFTEGSAFTHITESTIKDNKVHIPSFTAYRVYMVSSMPFMMSGIGSFFMPTQHIVSNES